jgi:quercetin dioxygenase-like cupin family protein
MNQAGRNAYVHHRGEGQSVWSLGGRFTMKVTDRDSEGRFALIEALATRATEPPLHIHRNEDEAWYILEGQMTFYVADQSPIEAGTGAFVYAPKGLAHTFTVDVEPTRVLLFASPAGFEHFALELGDTAVSDDLPAGLSLPAPEVLAAAAERYGIEIVGPPHRLA